MRPPNVKGPAPPGRPGQDRKGEQPHRSDTQYTTPPTHLNPDDTVPAVARRALHDLAHARREYRDTVSPDMSDALDTAMESLRRALTIAELEGVDDE